MPFREQLMEGVDDNVEKCQDEDEYVVKKQLIPPRFRQVYLALGINLVIVALCTAEGFTAILLPQLQETKEIEVNQEEESWIASITVLPVPFACLLSGWMIEAIGRKYTFLVTCIPLTVAWLLIYLAPNLTCLLIGRFLNGVCIGCLAAPAQVYLAELSEPNFRGFLLSTTAFAYTFGIVLAHVLGTYLSWRYVALIIVFFPIVGFFTLVFCPESPIFLMKKGRIDNAKQAFHWSRGYGRESKKELDELLRRQTEQRASPVANNKFKQFLYHLKKPEFYKPLLILIVFFATMQWSGSFAMIFYTVTIIKQTLGDNINEYTAMLITDGIRLICTTVGLYLFNKLRRRFLTIFSCTGVVLSLFALSLCEYLRKHQDMNTSTISLVAFVTYMAFMVLGLQNLPWIMSGELFPKASRGFGNGITSMISFALSFSVVKTTPMLFSDVGTAGAFLLFGCVCLIGMVVLIFYLPETKDITLQEIEDRFRGSSKNRKN